LLVRYGGHAAAAGFTVENKNLPALRQRLQQIAADQLDTASLRPSVTVDAEINLRGVNEALVSEIAALQPFGYGNPTPRFVSRNLTAKQARTVGRDGQHLRLTLHDGKQPWNGIGFGQGQWASRLPTGQPVDAVFSLEFNEWNGRRSLQLNIKDLRVADDA
jgi:single-stranded-DNA-specific exonuclease